MMKTQIVVLIKELNSKERKDFLKYLKKLYNRSRLLKLSEHLCEYIGKEGQEAKLNRVYIHQQVLKLPTSDKKHKLLLNLGSELKKILEEFLLLQYIKEDTFLYDYITARVYLDRNMPDHFTKQLSRLKRNREEAIKNNGITIKQQHDALLLEEMVYFDEMEQDAIEKTNHLQQAWQYLSEYNLLLKLKFCCELINRGNVLEESHQVSLAEELDRYRKENKLPSPLMSLYERTYKLLLTKELELFHLVREMVFSASSPIALTERSHILGYLINMSIYYNANGKEGFLEVLLAMCKNGDELNILSTNGRITSTRFHNVVNVSSYLNEYAWLSKFISKYRTHLPVVSEEDAFKLSNAQEAFERKHYQEAVDLVTKSKFPNIYFKIRAKSLLLRSLYVLNNDVSDILLLCRSFAQLVKRDKVLNKKTIKGCLAFIEILREMTLFRENAELRKENKVSKEELLEWVSKETVLQYRKWLAEWIHQL